jgi:hypothetical protein
LLSKGKYLILGPAKDECLPLQMPNIPDTLLKSKISSNLQLLSRRWRPRWSDTILRHNVAMKTSPTCTSALILQTITCIYKWKDFACGRLSVGASNAGCMATLEEVYKQAAAAAPLLHAKATTLSLESRSADSQILVLPVVISGTVARSMKDGEEGKTDGTLPVSGRGSPALGVKPWGRAVEKLVRCYGGDPARLVDCCRQAGARECN